MLDHDEAHVSRPIEDNGNAFAADEHATTSTTNPVAERPWVGWPETTAGRTRGPSLASGSDTHGASDPTHNHCPCGRKSLGADKGLGETQHTPHLAAPRPKDRGPQWAAA